MSFAAWMGMRIFGGIVLITVTVLFAQSFPAEFKTRDADVNTRLNGWLTRHAEGAEDGAAQGFGSDLGQLFAGPFNRVYKAMDDSRRVAALQTCLPLIKRLLMSDAVMKVHDAQVAKEFGAVNHGVAVPASSNSARATPELTGAERIKELAAAARANPMLVQDPKFLAEMQRLSANVNAQVATAVKAQNGASGINNMLLRADAKRYTMDLAELKEEVTRAKANARGSVAQCYEDALILAGVNSDMFRLRSAKCNFMSNVRNLDEAALDKDRKIQAQILYNEKGAKGILKNALNEFIQTAAKVDYAAPTKARGMNTVFVSPEHEKQGPLWKAIYRNGKAPTDAAVAFAKTWLAEL